MSKTVNFEMVLNSAVELPLVKIEREEFLKAELSPYYDEQTVNKAIQVNPAYAGISINEIDKIAKACINFEATKVSIVSGVAGIPGGIVMVGTVPSDFIQYFGHVLRILQKLIYLYGWQEIFSDGEKMNDETSNLLTLFVGIMFGVNGASVAITKIADIAAEKTAKSLAQKTLTKGILYPTIKKIATKLGIRMTKEIFAKTVSKIIPIVGGVASGGLTYITYKPMAEKLKRHLETLKLADVHFYRQTTSMKN